MKTVVAFAFLIAGITALTQPEGYPVALNSERLGNDAIVKAIEGVSQSIRDAGLDPLYIEKKEVSYALPVPVIFNSATHIEELLFSGLSNIVVHTATYSPVRSQVNVDVELPLVHLNLGGVSSATTLFGHKLEIKGSGKVDIRSIRLICQIIVRVSPRGVSVRSVSVKFSLGGIESDVKLVIQDKDHSENINKFLNATIPETLKQYSAEVNELIEIVMMDQINASLKK